MAAGVMARMICSARMYQNDPKVTVLCRLVGLEGTPLPFRCWPFLVQALACLQGLFVDLWPGIVQASITNCHGGMTDRTCLQPTGIGIHKPAECSVECVFAWCNMHVVSPSSP